MGRIGTWILALLLAPVFLCILGFYTVKEGFKRVVDLVTPAGEIHGVTPATVTVPYASFTFEARGSIKITPLELVATEEDWRNAVYVPGLGSFSKIPDDRGLFRRPLQIIAISCTAANWSPDRTRDPCLTRDPGEQVSFTIREAM